MGLGGMLQGYIYGFQLFYVIFAGEHDIYAWKNIKQSYSINLKSSVFTVFQFQTIYKGITVAISRLSDIF
jgi:hypothetical protein